MILITLLGEIALGYGLLGWLARRTSRHPQLARVVLLSYSVRVALGIVLYVVSLWKWPILRSLQVDHGFWSFSPDCGVYHYFGQQIADAWRKGIELPDTVFGFEYFALVAAVYRLLGPHPLFPIVVNCALAAGTGLLAYLISRRFLEERAAIVSAALVGFWPSTFIWSAQLLKDPLSWFLLFAALWLIVSLVPSRGAEGGRLLGMLVRWVLLGLVMILLTRARFYLGSALSLATLVVLLPAGCVACIQKASRRRIQCVSLVAMVVLSVLFARTLNVVKLLSPANPAVAHYNLAILDWEKGELIEATREFYRALELRGDFQKAYLGVAAVQIQLANWESAIRAYEQYIEREAPEKRWPISQLISRLYSELGNDHFINRQVGQAIAAYEHAIALDPSQADILANLGLELSPAEAVLPRGALHTLDLSSAEAVLSTATPQDDLPAPPLQASVAGARPERITAQLISANRHEILAMATRLFSSRTGRPEGKLGRESRFFAEFPVQLNAQAIKMVSEPTSGALGYRREGFVSAGGHALMDAETKIKDIDSMTRYAPRALAIGFLAPFPWQWFDTHGSTGAMRLLAGMEMLLVYGLIPGILCGLWDVLRWRRLEGLLLIAYIVFTAIPISLVVANVGTLFRLRLFFLLPLLIVAAEGDPIGVYSRMWRWLAGLRRQGVRGVVKDDQAEISGVTSSPRKEVPVSTLLDVIGQSEEGN